MTTDGGTTLTDGKNGERRGLSSVTLAFYHYWSLKIKTLASFETLKGATGASPPSSGPFAPIVPCVTVACHAKRPPRLMTVAAWFASAVQVVKPLLKARRLRAKPAPSVASLP